MYSSSLFLPILKVQDMHEFKTVIFFLQIYADDLPRYFDVYRPYQNKMKTPYALRHHPISVPQVAQVYAEASIVYTLVSMKIKYFYLKNKYCKKNKVIH